MSVSKLMELKAGQSGHPIEIRVLRKWETKFKPGELSLLLIDKQGTPVQASTNESNKEYIDSRLNLMACYQLKEYICTHSPTFMKIVDADISLRVGRATQINQIPNADDIPRYYFQFHNFEDLRNRCNRPDIFTDYVGTVETIQDYYTRNGDPYIRLTLKNERDENINVAIWKESLTTFNREELNNAQYPAILAVSSAKVSINPQNGQLQLGTSDASYIYINPDIPDVEALQNRQNNELSITTTQMLASQTSTDTTLMSLTTLPTKDITGKIHVCTASIHEYEAGKDWFYATCSKPGCGITLLPSNKQWACISDGIDNNPVYAYRIHAIISDPPANANVTIFDQVAQSLLETPCSTLIKEGGYTDPKTIPEPLQQLIGQPLKFGLYKTDRVRYTQTAFIVKHVSKIGPALLEGAPSTAPKTPISSRKCPAPSSEEIKKKMKSAHMK